LPPFCTLTVDSDGGGGIGCQETVTDHLCSVREMKKDPGRGVCAMGKVVV
jgi:hypothetical protein